MRSPDRILSYLYLQISCNTAQIPATCGNNSVQMYIYGCINPPAMESGYNGTLLTDEDMDRASEELVGKPILMEHLGPPIGTVKAVWRRPRDDRLMMVGHTDEDGVHADFARSMLADSSWGELSLSTTVPVNMKSFETGRKTFNEISVVKRGARDGTTIELCEKQTTPGKYKSDASTHQLIECSANKMNTNADVGAAASPSDPSNSAGSPEGELLRRYFFYSRFLC
jgi:hypothetical protein